MFMHAMLNVRRRLFFNWIVFKFHQILVFVSVSWNSTHTRTAYTPTNFPRAHEHEHTTAVEGNLHICVFNFRFYRPFSFSLSHIFPQFLGFSVRSRSSLIQLKLYQLIGLRPVFLCGVYPVDSITIRRANSWHTVRGTIAEAIVALESSRLLVVGTFDTNLHRCIVDFTPQKMETKCTQRWNKQSAEQIR